MINSIESPARRNSAGARALRHRVLQAGFWFFVLKGLLWLAVPTLLQQALAA